MAKKKNLVEEVQPVEEVQEIVAETQPVEENKDPFFAVKKIVEEKDENGRTVKVEVTEYPNIPVVVVNGDEENHL